MDYVEEFKVKYSKGQEGNGISKKAWQEQPTLPVWEIVTGRKDTETRAKER